MIMDRIAQEYAKHPGRSTNRQRVAHPLESRQGGPWGSEPSLRAAAAFKLIEAAQDRRRAVNAPYLVALVRAGAVFRDGVLAERPEQAAA